LNQVVIIEKMQKEIKQWSPWQHHHSKSIFHHFNQSLTRSHYYATVDFCLITMQLHESPRITEVMIF